MAESTTPNLFIKISRLHAWPNPETRVITMDAARCSYEILKNEATFVFKYRQAQLYWKDPAGEYIMLSSDKELDTYIKFMGYNKNYHFYLKEIKSTSAAYDDKNNSQLATVNDKIGELCSNNNLKKCSEELTEAVQETPKPSVQTIDRQLENYEKCSEELTEAVKETQKPSVQTIDRQMENYEIAYEESQMESFPSWIMKFFCNAWCQNV